MPLRRSSAHSRIAIAGISTRIEPWMPEEEAGQIGLAAIEKAGHQEGHAGRQRQEHDQEHRRDRGGEIGGEFAAKHQQGRAHVSDLALRSMVICAEHVVERGALAGRYSVTAMLERPSKPASSSTEGRVFARMDQRGGSRR